MDKKFSFDDILLVPIYSEIERGDVNILSEFFDYILDVPILSSPMDTITGKEMLMAMLYNGGFGIHHRYCYENGVLQIQELVNIADNYHCGIAVSPSMGMDFINQLYTVSPNLIVVLDIAHGNTKRNLDFCEEMSKLGIKNIVSGNIVTQDAALRYYNVGVKYLRVGIGGGSVCTTRLVTGVGYPQASAIMEIDEMKVSRPDMKIISDGGHRTTGDIVKALALGADFVMLGGMLAGTDEAEGMTEIDGKKFGAYRGMASEEALSTRKKEFFVEGKSTNVEPKGPVKGVLENIKDAIEQACYYTGSKNLQELRETVKILLTSGGMRESYVR